LLWKQYRRLRPKPLHGASLYSVYDVVHYGVHPFSFLSHEILASSSGFRTNGVRDRSSPDPLIEGEVFYRSAEPLDTSTNQLWPAVSR